MSEKLSKIAQILGAEIDERYSQIEISSVASLETASEKDISFLSNKKYLKYLIDTKAAAVIIQKGTETTGTFVPVFVDDPYLAFLKILVLFDTRNIHDIADGISEHAYIHPKASIGSNVSIGPFSVIGENVIIGDNSIIGPCSVILKNSKIGKDCILYPNITIMDESVLGDRVIIHAGAVIGSDGFGFAPDAGKFKKIPQIGKVRIGNDVEIGACTTIDRAAFGETIVEDGTKIDNLVQIAHNVKVGTSTVIAAQTGISGSSAIGNYVRMGGQSGISGHLNIGDFANIGAQAGVTKDVPKGETFSGYPAEPHAKALRLDASIRKLPELIKKVREQEIKIEKLEKMIKNGDS